MSTVATPSHLRAHVPMSVSPPAVAPASLAPPTQPRAEQPAPVPALQPNAAVNGINIGPQAQPHTLSTWLAANWLMCVIIVCVLLLIFVVGMVFFRSPAPKVAPKPPNPPNAQANAQAQPQAQAAPANAADQASAQPPAQEPAPAGANTTAPALDYNALLQRGQAVLAAPAPMPDETSEEEILRLMQPEAPKEQPAEEPPKVEEVDEKKL